MLGSSVSFAVMAVAAKYASKRLSASEIIFIRSLLSSLFIVVFLSKKGHSDWVGKKPVILAARGLVGFVAMTFYFWSIPRIHLGTAMMLNYTAPIFAIILTHLFMHEKTSALQKIIIGLSFAGVYFLTAPDLAASPFPLFVGLLSGLLAGMVHILIRQSHQDETPLVIIFYFTVISTIGSAALLPLGGFLAPTPKEWLALLIVTVSSFIGQVGLTYSLRTAPVSVVSPFGYFSPVLGVFLGWLFWKEIPGGSSLAGSALIILCGTGLYRLHSKKPSDLF